MGLTSTSFLVVLVVLALAAPAAAVLGWNRVGGRAAGRWLCRGGMLIAVEATGCLLLAGILNDANDFFVSWHDLFGAAATSQGAAVDAGALDATLLRRAAADPGHSLLQQISVPTVGAAGSQPAEVYLPAAYFAAGNDKRAFPVVELLDGFPGGPQSWVHPMAVQQTLDAEIAAGRVAPFVAVMPSQNFQGTHDGECINAVHGVQVESTLVDSVRAVVTHDLRVGRAADQWSVMGFSTGGYCSLNIALRHPGLFGSAVSMEGYVTPYLDETTGPLFGTGHAAHRDHWANDPLWQVQHGHDPRVSVLMTYDDGDYVPHRDALRFAAAFHAPLSVSLLHMPGGAHNFATFRALEPICFDWIGQHLDYPTAPSVSLAGARPVLVHPRSGLITQLQKHLHVPTVRRTRSPRHTGTKPGSDEAAGRARH